MPTSISWTNETINFWMGCDKVSQGCKNCYMYRDFAKYGRDPKALQVVNQWPDHLQALKVRYFPAAFYRYPLHSSKTKQHA